MGTLVHFCSGLPISFSCLLILLGRDFVGLMAMWIHVRGRLRFQFTFRSSMYSMVRFFPLDLKAPLWKKKKEPSLIKGRHLHAVKHVKNLFVCMLGKSLILWSSPSLWAYTIGLVSLHHRAATTLWTTTLKSGGRPLGAGLPIWGHSDMSLESAIRPLWLTICLHM